MTLAFDMYNNLPDNTIFGVEIKELKSHPDGRGFFREVIRSTDPIFQNPTPDQSNFGQSNFGQWSHSKMQKNVVKAWHYHHIQTDWWYIPVGLVETVLFDNREESPTYRQKMLITMGESTLGGEEITLKIPPGVLHGCKVLSEISHLFYITSTTYNPQDEGRLPYNTEVVPHIWGDNLIVAENDKKSFKPIAKRTKI